MNKPVISSFKQSPKTKGGKWALGLCFIAFLSGPLLGISAAIIVPFVSKSSWGDTAGVITGFSMMILMVGVIITSLILSINALRKGERSWGVWLAFAFSSLSVLFWILFIIGEFLFPH